MSYRPPIIVRPKRIRGRIHALHALVAVSIVAVGIAFALGLRDGTHRATYAAALPAPPPTVVAATSQLSIPPVRIEELPAAQPARSAASAQNSAASAPDSAIEIIPVPTRQQKPYASAIPPPALLSPTRQSTAGATPRAATTISDLVPDLPAANPPYRAPAATLPDIGQSREPQYYLFRDTDPRRASSPPHPRDTEKRPDRPRSDRNARRDRKDERDDWNNGPSDVRRRYDHFFSENDFQDERR